MGLIFKDADNTAVDPKATRLWSILFFGIVGILALIGVLALVLLLHDEVGSGFRMPRRMAMGLLSSVVVCGGLILLLFGIRAKKEAIRMSAARGESDEKPWLQRKDWAAGRIISSSKKAAWLLWIFVFFWCGASGAISLVVVPAQLHQGNHAALVALVFPVIGLALIFFVWRTTLAWRRFGKSIFGMPAVPAPAGGALEGEIQVRGKLRPEHGWHLTLSCIRRKTTGPTNNLRTTEKILWQDEKWLRPDLLKKDATTTVIPVYFQLPGDKPESTPQTGDGSHWRLEAWARLPGPNFHAAFEVPVFRPPEPAQMSADPTLPYQLSLDEIRKQIHSKIQIVDLPNGKEFVFPAGRNPGFALGAAAVCFIWTIIVVLLALNHAPVPVPLVFGAMDLLMLFFVFDLWYRRSRVLISGDTVKVETAWPGYKKEDSLKISDAVNFLAETGPTVGHAAYYDLKLKTQDGKELTLAKNLSHKPEANWLARQMTAAARNVSAINANA